jgi:hypothetical protein
MHRAPPPDVVAKVHKLAEIGAELHRNKVDSIARRESVRPS